MTTPATDRPWNPLKEPRDYAIVAGVRTPGLCDIVGASSPRKWEEIDGYGLSGARLKFKGIGLARFSMKLRLYTDQDWNDWDRFRVLMRKPPLGKRPLAKLIVHPQLAEVGVTAFVVEELMAPERTDDSGEWTIEIKCIEFRLPTPALSKPDAAEATPADPEEVKIGLLLDQNNKLAALDDSL